MNAVKGLVTTGLSSVSPYGSPGLPDDDTITVEQWLADTSITEGTRRNRRKWLRYLGEANGGRTAREIVEDVRAGKVKAYQIGLNLVNFLRNKGMKPSTVAQLRSMFPEFIQSTAGEEKLSKAKFDRLVPRGPFYTSKSKKTPTKEEFKTMLRHAEPQYRAMLGVLACTGARISEVVSRRMTDLEARERKRIRVKFQASETKARTKRYAFLTTETAEWIGQHRLRVEARAKRNGEEPSEWLFPAGEGRGHLKPGAAYHEVKKLFRMAGLRDAPDETYSPHSFRTFADAQMAKAGLDRKYIAAIIGHKSKLAAEAHYLDWGEIESEWFEKCEEPMTWLIERHEIITEVQDPVARGLLKKLIEELAKAETFDDVGDLSGLIEAGEKALEDKTHGAG